MKSPSPDRSPATAAQKQKRLAESVAACPEYYHSYRASTPHVTVRRPFRRRKSPARLRLRRSRNLLCASQARRRRQDQRRSPEPSQGLYRFLEFRCPGTRRACLVELLSQLWEGVLVSGAQVWFAPARSTQCT